MLKLSECRTLLQVEVSASEDEINRAFLRRAKEVHPDVNQAPDATEQFVRLKQARDLLLDQVGKAEPSAKDVPRYRPAKPVSEDKREEQQQDSRREAEGRRRSRRRSGAKGQAQRTQRKNDEFLEELARRRAALEADQYDEKAHLEGARRNRERLGRAKTTTWEQFMKTVHRRRRDTKLRRDKERGQSEREAQERAEYATRERAQREQKAQVRAEREAREREQREREARERAEREARERAQREQKAQVRAEREAREREQREREARERAEREARERAQRESRTRPKRAKPMEDEPEMCAWKGCRETELAAPLPTQLGPRRFCRMHLDEYIEFLLRKGSRDASAAGGRSRRGGISSDNEAPARW